MSVLTFNVNFGVAGHPDNLEAVRRADADVVLLQETTERSETSFHELAEVYPFQRFADCCRAGGLGFLSKYPIVSESYLSPEAGWFPAWRITVDTPMGAVQTLNVHLRPPVSEGGSWVSGHFTTKKIRRQEIEAFWASMEPEVPAVVAGDFNENAGGSAVEFLTGQGLRSALPQVDAKAKTWHWPTRLGELTAMLDHVMYGPRLRLLHAEVREPGPSDHVPVLVTLDRNPTGPR